MSFRSEAASLLRLAFPIIVGLAAATLIGVVDTVMIAPLGTVPLAAASLATSVVIVILSAVYGLISVTGIRIAQAHGAGGAGVGTELRHGLALALVAGFGAAALMAAVFPLLPWLGQPQEALAILLPYWLAMSAYMVPFALVYTLKALFDAVDRPWTGAAFAFLGVVANVPLNWLLIYGAGLGLAGAGLASVLSEGIALLAALAFLRWAPSMAGVRARADVTRAGVLERWREGWPVAVGYLGEGGSYAMVGLMTGWFGAVALAANQIVNAVGGVAYMIPLGMAAAVSVRVGQAVGAGERARLRPIARAALALVAGWGLLLTLCFLLLGGPLARALSDDPAVIGLATLLFVAVAAIQVVDGVQSTAMGALRGLLDTRVPTVISLVALWPVALPLSVGLAVGLDLGPVGIWVGFGAGLAVAAVALPLRYWRMTR